jgi:hypothetical protein
VAPVKLIKGTATNLGSYAGTVARVGLVTVPLIASPVLTRTPTPCEVGPLSCPVSAVSVCPTSIEP